MSPPFDPPGGRIRRLTTPPAPPSDLNEAVRDLQHGHGTLERGQADLAHELQEIKTLMQDVRHELTVVRTERTAEKDRAKVWSKISTSVAIAVILAFGGFLLKFAIVLNANHVSP